MTTLSAPQKIQLKIDLISALKRSSSRLGALACTGAITTRAYEIDHQDLNLIFERFTGFLEHNQLDPERHLAGIIAIGIVSEVELYLSDVFKIVVFAHPEMIGSTPFTLSDFISKPKEELVQIAAEKKLNTLFYQKPKEYLSGVCSLLSIDEIEFSTSWPMFIEAKARRDIGIHNGWIANATYLRKLTEGGIPTDVILGDLICPNLDYVYDMSLAIANLLKQFHSNLISTHCTGV